MANYPDTEKLMKLVPEDGSLIGNVSLMAQLPFTEERFWKVREQLLQSGDLERGRGRGGSVRRATTKVNSVVVPRAVKNPPEAQLYELLLTTLKTDWVREMEIEPYHIVFEITASQRKNLVRGRWIQPDITAVSVRTFRHIPNKYVDVWTFEVKAVESLDVKSVFEAAAHASRATRSYALLQVPDDESNPYDDVLERCEREATRLGVGLITFSTPGDFKTWETRVEAPRLETAPEVLDEFVGHLTQGVKDRIATWK